MDLEITQKKEFAVSTEELLLDKAQLLGLNPVELTLLVGGMRAMGVSHSGEEFGPKVN